MTAEDFIAKHAKSEVIADFAALSNEDRVTVLEHLGNPCSRCGALDKRWCCYDLPNDLD